MRALDYGWWLASRASGVVALVLVTVSVAIGLMMAGKVARRPGAGRALLAVHQQTALAGLVAIAVHGITLLGDSWLHPGVKGVLVPFAMDYRPLYTGLGVVSGYLAVLLGLSFYARKQIGARLWRKLHKATLLVYVLSVIHVLGAGTDAATPWMRAWLAASAVPIVLLFAARVRHGRGVSARKARAAAAPAASAAARASRTPSQPGRPNRDRVPA